MVRCWGAKSGWRLWGAARQQQQRRLEQHRCEWIPEKNESCDVATHMLVAGEGSQREEGELQLT